MNYRNPQLDALLGRAAVETDLAKRKPMYFEAEKIIHDPDARDLLDGYVLHEYLEQTRARSHHQRYLDVFELGFSLG